MTDTSASTPRSSLLARLVGNGRSRVGLVAALIAALAVRLPGLTSKDLWFDDAWAAMPARASFRDALHMVVTTPGYTLVSRLWIGLYPEATWWAQLPTLLFGLLGVVAIFCLLRYLNTSELVQWICTAIVVLSPTTVTYSTRVKEYAFDFLLGVALLALAERVRRTPRAKHLIHLGLVSVVSVFFSLSSAVVVLGIWLAVGLLALWQRELRARIFGIGAATALLGAAVALPFAAAVPSVLNHNWRRRGFLFDPSSFHDARRTLTTIFSGLAHGLIGVPIHLNPHVTFWKLWAIAIALVVIAFLVLAGRSAARRTLRSRPTFSRTTPAAMILVVATFAALASRVPLGDGRTDEVIFPAILVLGALVFGPTIDAGFAKLGRKSPTLPRIALAAALLGAVIFGGLHTSRYPTIDLRGLASKWAPTTKGDTRLVTVVDGFNAFGWGYYALSPTTIAFGPDHSHIWPQGFHIAATTNSVIISNNNMSVPGRFAHLAARADAVWYIGFEQGTYNPYSPMPYALRPSATYFELLREGWKPRPGYSLLAEHCYAMLLTR